MVANSSHKSFSTKRIQAACSEYLSKSLQCAEQWNTGGKKASLTPQPAKNKTYPSWWTRNSKMWVTYVNENICYGALQTAGTQCTLQKDVFLVLAMKTNNIHNEYTLDAFSYNKKLISRNTHILKHGKNRVVIFEMNSTFKDNIIYTATSKSAEKEREPKR